MEQPKFLNSSPSPQQQQQQQQQQQSPSSKPNNNSTKTTKQKLNLPTPQDLITHYESQGMNTQEASIKVIDDLQHMLFRVVTSTKGKKDNPMLDASRKLDLVNARLAIVEKKLDSKPGFAESFGIGFATATAFNGVAAVWPQVVGGVWDAVRGFTKT